MLLAILIVWMQILFRYSIYIRISIHISSVSNLYMHPYQYGRNENGYGCLYQGISISVSEK